MKVQVHESPVLAEIVKQLLLTLDPDFPATSSTGVSLAINHKLEELFTIAADDVTHLHTTLDEFYSLVRMIRKDPALKQLAALPWVHVQMMDAEGTIVLIF